MVGSVFPACWPGFTYPHPRPPTPARPRKSPTLLQTILSALVTLLALWHPGSAPAETLSPTHLFQVPQHGVGERQRRLGRRAHVVGVGGGAQKELGGHLGLIPGHSLGKGGFGGLEGARTGWACQLQAQRRRKLLPPAASC